MNDRIVEQDSDILSLTESNEKLKKSNDEYSEKFKKLTKNIKKMEDTYSKKLKKYKTYESKRKISLIASGFKATPTASSLKNFNLKRESLATADELNQYLKGTGLAGLGYYFKYCEAVDGINAVALMSITAVESGWGKSNLAVNKNNILSWCAYDGSAYSSASSFSSMSDCLVKCTPTIAKNYLSTNGKYYNGATLVGMNKNYSSSKNWSSQCANIMADFDKKIK
jgi:beta-N-acetylglucosaminidase